MAETEQVFFNDPLLLLKDSKHSQREKRNHALGKTDEGRLLHITFAFRALCVLDKVKVWLGD